MYNYLILTTVSGKNFCILEKVYNAPEPLAFDQGISLKPWPDNVLFIMDPNFPKAIQLADCLQNLPDALIVSERLKLFFEEQKLSHIEYLPVSIINHKGRIASDHFFLVNPYPLQECIDLQKSNIEWNAIDPDLICACTNMIIDESKIKYGAKIFRLKHYPQKILIERLLSEKIDELGFTGVSFIEIQDMEY